MLRRNGGLPSARRWSTWLALWSALQADQALALGEVFVAEPPYWATVGNGESYVDLDGKARRHEFGGDLPFVRAQTGVSDIATINLWNATMNRAEVIASYWIGSDGAGGRVFKVPGEWAVGCLAGDRAVEGALRTQVNTFSIPARRRFVWDLSVRFGGAYASERWTFTPRGQSPATIWQLKTKGLPPPFVMVVDTDPQDSTRLMLHFDTRIQPAAVAQRVGEAGGLQPETPTEVLIDGYLDERAGNAGGKGYFRVWVNGRQVVNWMGPTLQVEASEPYSWSFGMYLYRDVQPLTFSRFSYWRRARLILH